METTAGSRVNQPVESGGCGWCADLKSACQMDRRPRPTGVVTPGHPRNRYPASHSRLTAPGPMSLSDVPGRAATNQPRFPPPVVRRPDGAAAVAEVAVAGGRGARAQYSAIAAGSNRTYRPIRTCGMRPSRACRSRHCASTESTAAAASAVSNPLPARSRGCTAAAAASTAKIVPATAAPSRRPVSNTSEGRESRRSPRTTRYRSVIAAELRAVELLLLQVLRALRSDRLA